MADSSPQPAAELEPGYFLEELTRQYRARDSHGALDNLTGQQLLERFILTPQQRRELPLIADLDGRTRVRVEAFYAAVTVALEKVVQQVTRSQLELNHEGFGGVLIYSGRLVLVDKTLRDTHRFGFPSLEALSQAGEKMVAEGAQLARLYPQVAGL